MGNSPVLVKNVSCMTNYDILQQINSYDSDSDKNMGLDMKSNAKGLEKELPTGVSVSNTNLHIQ